MGLFDLFKDKPYWEEGYDGEYNCFTCYDGWEALDRYGNKFEEWEEGLRDDSDVIIITYYGENIRLEIIVESIVHRYGFSWKCSFNDKEYESEQQWCVRNDEEAFYRCTESLRDFSFDNVPNEYLYEVEEAFDTVPQNPRVLSRSSLVYGSTMNTNKAWHRTVTD